MTYEQLLSVCKAALELLMSTDQAYTKLVDQHALLQEQNCALLQRNAELEARLKMNSRNSSKPPSTDEFVKPRSLRGKSDRPSGGQVGHPGHTLRMVDNPDKIVVHQLDVCQGCGGDLLETLPNHVKKRQVFDLPPMKMEVTEHQAVSKCCPHCGCITNAEFPADVIQPVQYGDNLEAFCVYLSQYQLLPYKRTMEIVQDICNHHITEGTLFKMLRNAYETLASMEQATKQTLCTADVVHVDETGMQVGTKRLWLHVTSTDKLTFYAWHPKRGALALDDISILPGFKGTAVHDGWKAYFAYKCHHALCNAHHIRELKGIIELTEQKWPQRMIDLLLEIKAAVENSSGRPFTKRETRRFEQRYEQIIDDGYLQNPMQAAPLIKRRDELNRAKRETC